MNKKLIFPFILMLLEISFRHSTQRETRNQNL